MAADDINSKIVWAICIASVTTPIIIISAIIYGVNKLFHTK